MTCEYCGTVVVGDADCPDFFICEDCRKQTDWKAFAQDALTPDASDRMRNRPPAYRRTYDPFDDPATDDALTGRFHVEEWEL